MRISLVFVLLGVVEVWTLPFKLDMARSCKELLDAAYQPQWVEGAHSACFNGKTHNPPPGWKHVCQKIVGNGGMYYGSGVTQLRFIGIQFPQESPGAHPLGFVVGTDLDEETAYYAACNLGKSNNHWDIVATDKEEYVDGDPFSSFVRIRMPTAHEAKCFYDGYHPSRGLIVFGRYCDS